MQTNQRKPKRIKKLDGVVEAAHFDADGQLEWVRAYERRGPTWSDRVLLDRATLVERLKAGKRFYVGSRRDFLASEFEVTVPLRLVQFYRGEALVTGSGKPKRDELNDIPLV